MLLISCRLKKKQTQPNTNSGLVRFSIIKPTNLIVQTKNEKNKLVRSFPKRKRIKYIKGIEISNDMSSKNTYYVQLAFLYSSGSQRCVSLRRKYSYPELLWSVFSLNAEKCGPE